MCQTRHLLRETDRLKSPLPGDLIQMSTPGESPHWGLTAGWNELVLPISSATKSGSPDLNAINFFRVYQDLSASITAKIDDIRFLETASPETSGDPLDIPAG